MVNLNAVFSLQETNNGSQINEDTALIQGTRLNVELLRLNRDSCGNPVGAQLNILNKETMENYSITVEAGDSFSKFNYTFSISDIRGHIATATVDMTVSQQDENADNLGSENLIKMYNGKVVDMGSAFLLQELNNGSVITLDWTIVQSTQININLVGFDRDSSNTPVKAHLSVLDKSSMETINLTAEKSNKYSVFDYQIEIQDIRGGFASSAVELIITKSNGNYSDCTDSDGGINIYEKGTTSTAEGSMDDVCSTSTNVMEFFCQYNDIQGKNIKIHKWVDCPPNSVCEDGKCSEPCAGCLIASGNCVALGYRSGEQYCSQDKTMVSQKTVDVVCQDNYECSSNLCVDNKCISSSLWSKFLAWLSHLFK